MTTYFEVQLTNNQHMLGLNKCVEAGVRNDFTTVCATVDKVDVCDDHSLASRVFHLSK